MNYSTSSAEVKKLVIRTSDEAKSFTVRMTSRRYTHEEAIKALETFKDHLSRAFDQQNKIFWENQINELEAWLSSDEYKLGNYPQGIDSIILDLIEWRAMLYAFQHVDMKNEAFITSVFFQQWCIGASYAMFSLLAKLTSSDSRENSLRNLWWKVEKFVARDGACIKEERKEICAKFQKESGQFTNIRSRAILFRNTVIAHNEKSVQVEWAVVDEDIRALVRIWSILVSWSSFGIVSPFRSGDQSFSGLENTFNPAEIKCLKSMRQEYIDKTIQWARTFLHNGKNDLGGDFFAHLSVKIEPVAPSI